MKKNQNEQNKAVALRYDSTSNYSPEVIAKGERLVAERIVELAKKSNIPLYRDQQLVSQLMQVGLTQEIPAELYEAVATILAFVYRLDQEKGAY